MIATIIAYSMSGFCILVGVLMVLVATAEVNKMGPASSRLLLVTLICLGGLAWGFAYLGGLS